jgi:hypothetical protein
MAGRQLRARERVERALGKAVHPNAIDRLLEIWPDAYVEVKHYRTKLSEEQAKIRFSPPAIYRAAALRDAGEDPGSKGGATTVVLWARKPEEGPRGGHGIRHHAEQVRCYSGDTFDRRIGIELAFRRALRAVVTKTRWNDFGFGTAASKGEVT